MRFTNLRKQLRNGAWASLRNTFFATTDTKTYYYWWFRNPAPVDIVNIPLFWGFHTSQVVVWDFFHQQYHMNITAAIQIVNSVGTTCLHNLPAFQHEVGEVRFHTAPSCVWTRLVCLKDRSCSKSPWSLLRFCTSVCLPIADLPIHRNPCGLCSRSLVFDHPKAPSPTQQLSSSLLLGRKTAAPWVPNTSLAPHSLASGTKDATCGVKLNKWPIPAAWIITSKLPCAVSKIPAPPCPGPTGPTGYTERVLPTQRIKSQLRAASRALKTNSSGSSDSLLWQGKKHHNLHGTPRPTSYKWLEINWMIPNLYIGNGWK